MAEEQVAIVDPARYSTVNVELWRSPALSNCQSLSAAYASHRGLPNEVQLRATHLNQLKAPYHTDRLLRAHLGLGRRATPGAETHMSLLRQLGT